MSLKRFASRTSICRIHSLSRKTTTVHVEIVESPSEIMNGLMNREVLPWDSGMVFLFPSSRRTSFWMKNTSIPLSIAFWNENDTIVDILDMEPCEGPDCPSYTPQADYIGALEVNQGFFRERGIDIGDRIELVNMTKQASTDTRNLDIPIHPDLMKALHELHGQGHQSLVVGGAVRDALTGDRPKDIDVEVYGPSYEHLTKTLSKHGKVDVVGKAFGVIKFTDSDGEAHDVSLPRKDSKSGVGHKDFEVKTDAGLSPKEAASRRDFTINSMGWNPITKEFHDYHGGEEDLKNKVLRHTSDAFSEDPLRVLRGMQFATRYGMTLHPDTAKKCRDIADQYDTLPKERVSEEFMKMATKGKEPGRALDYLEETGWMKHLPHLAKMRKTEQDTEWHPEGDVHEHTKHAMNAAAKICDEEGITGDDRATAVLGTMVHDIGKATSSQVTNKNGRDRITSHGHEQEGGPLARETLESIGVKPDIVNRVQPIVENHLAHINFEKGNTHPRVIRRLAQRLHPASVKDASVVMRADHAGRPPLSGDTPTGVTNMLKAAEDSKVTEHKQEPIVKGRHVLEHGIEPGPPVGAITRAAYEAQTNGEFSDEAGGKKWLHDYMQNTKTSSWKRVIFS